MLEDSIRQVKLRRVDSARVQALENRYYLFENSNSDSAIAIATRQLTLSRKINHAASTGRALMNLGRMYHMKGQDEQALVFLYRAKDLFEQIDDKRGLGKTLVAMGMIPENQGRHDKALNLYFKALKAFESVDDEEGKADVFTNMGNLHKKQYNFAEALKFYERALKGYKSIGKKERVASVLGNMATAYNGLDDMDKALEMDFEALRIYERTNNVRGIGSVANNIGVIYFLKSLYKDALGYFTMALEKAQQVDQKDLIALSLCNIAEVHVYLEDYGTAMKYFEEGIDLTKRLKNQNQLVNAYEGLTRLYERIGNTAQALETYKKSAEIKERLLDDERSRAMAELQANYENEQKEKEIAFQNLVITKQRGENRMLMALTVLAAILLAALIYGYFRIRKTSQELEKLSLVASNTHNGVMILDKDGNLEYVNDGFVQLSGYTRDELVADKGSNILEISANPDIAHVWERVLRDRIPVSYLAINQDKSGKSRWLSTTLSPVFNEKGEVQKIVGIDTDFTENKRKSEEIEKSIAYAKKIQEAILPMRNQIMQAFPDSFILYQPKAVVSGDFYWFAEKNGYKYFAVADCTGHGVPGAFMSVLGSNALNQIIRRENKESPAEILSTLHLAIRRSLKQDVEGSESREGMDIALCRLDTHAGILKYSGANRPLYLTKDGELQEIRPDKKPVGGYQLEARRTFTEHEISIRSGDMVYLFSDGYPDQFGGPDGKKFMNRRFRKLVTQICDLPPEQQKQVLEDQFRTWQGEEEQIDDVLVMGIGF